MYMAEESKREHKRSLNHKNKAIALSNPTRPILMGKRIFKCSDVVIQHRVNFHAALRSLKMITVTERTHADVFLVNDVTRPPQRVIWNAILSGGIVASLPYIMSHGERGPCLVYKKAVDSKRVVWCSPRFWDLGFNCSS